MKLYIRAFVFLVKWTGWVIIVKLFLRDKKYVTHHAKKGLIVIAKSFDRGQPARTAQADHGRNFSLLADFLCFKWKLYLI